MTAYTMSQTWTNLRQALRRYAWWFSLSLVLVMAALAAYRAVSVPVASVPIMSPQTLSVNPAQQAVFDYLWAHSSDQPIQAPAATIEPAQQSVMHYLHAHNRVDLSPTFWDQAAQAVLDYLRAHSR